MVERRIILAGIILSLTLPGVSGCSTLLPPLLGPSGAGSGGSNVKVVERIHSKGLAATSAAKTDKQLEVVKDLTKKAMDKASVPDVYDPYKPGLAEKIAYTTQFAGKTIEKTAPVFPLAPVVGGGVTLLGSLVATGLGWGRLMRSRKMLMLAGRDREELERTAGTLIEGIENFSSENTEAGKLLKELIKNKSIASGTSTRLHNMVKGRA